MKADRDASRSAIVPQSASCCSTRAGRGVRRPPLRHADNAGMADAARRDRPGRDPAPGGSARTGGRDRYRQGRDHRRKPGLAAIRSAGRARRQRMGRALPGQRQKWFVMRFTGRDSDINLATEHPEFDAWRWVAPYAPAGADSPVQAPALHRHIGRVSRALRAAGLTGRQARHCRVDCRCVGIAV